MTGDISCKATGGKRHERHDWIIFYSTRTDPVEIMASLSNKRPNFCTALQNQIEYVWDFGTESEVRTTARGGAEFLHKKHMLRIKEAKNH